MNKGKLVLVRHGLSVYNDQNRFTGWKDVELNQQGNEEAEQAGLILKNIDFDLAFTSNLVRAQNTLEIILKEIEKSDLPIEKNIALNERDYGDLIGQNKTEAAEKFGSEQVHIWRRSYDIPPPGGESLKDTAERVIPYLQENIMPHVFDGKNILVSAHGNSIRAIVMSLKNYTPKEILKTEIGWCEPWVFDFEEKKLINLEIIPRPNVNSMSRLPN